MAISIERATTRCGAKNWSPSAMADLKTIAEWIEQTAIFKWQNRIGRAIYDA